MRENSKCYVCVSECVCVCDQISRVWSVYLVVVNVVPPFLSPSISLDQCRRRSCGYRQRCGFGMTEDGSSTTLCTCDHHLCDHKLNPLCGRDGQTYSSVCHLQLAECLSGSPIGILHFNHCENTVAVIL